MKIYFAGSIRGGRNDKDLYLQIINLLKKYGEVLTEHVGSKEITDRGERHDNKYLFKRDLEWVEASDVLVAEVSTPSLGVGYELGIAEKLGKKILCLWRSAPDKFLSAMIGGNPNFTVEAYNNLDDLEEVFKKFFS